MDIGKSLRIAMAQRGMKNTDVAKALGVHAQLVSSWRKTGNVGSKNLVKLCKLFKLQASEFISLGEEQL